MKKKPEILLWISILFGSCQMYDDSGGEVKLAGQSQSHGYSTIKDDNTDGKLTVHLYYTKNQPIADLDLIESLLYNHYDATVVRKGELKLPDWCIKKSDSKVMADSVLQFLNRSNPNIDAKIMLITNRVICTNRKLNGRVYPGWTIMGLAQLGGSSCVVSTATIKIRRQSRLSKVVLHEIGHTLGVPHCEMNDTCLMVDLKGKGAAIDMSSIQMCLFCRSLVDGKH